MICQRLRCQVYRCVYVVWSFWYLGSVLVNACVCKRFAEDLIKPLAGQDPPLQEEEGRGGGGGGAGEEEEGRGRGRGRGRWRGRWRGGLEFGSVLWRGGGGGLEFGSNRAPHVVKTRGRNERRSDLQVRSLLADRR